MPQLSSLLVLALVAQLATPALAAHAAPAPSPAPGAAATAPAPSPATPSRAARAPRARGGATATHIRIGCAVLPHRLPRPIVVIIPSVTVIVISVCWSPHDVFRQRRA